jgi:hypothetical protein
MSVFLHQNLTFRQLGLLPSSGVVYLPSWGSLERADLNNRTDLTKKLYLQGFIHSSSSVALQPFVGLWSLLQFHNPFYTVGRTPWTSDQPVARPLLTHRTTPTQNKRTHRRPCLEWNSNPRPQRPSERRQFMP